jgi:hypothetical protein
MEDSAISFAEVGGRPMLMVTLPSVAQQRALYKYRLHR